MPCLPERHHADDQSSQASERNYALYVGRSHTPRRAILHRESRTFAHRSAAVSWAKHREVVLEDPSARTRVQHSAPTLAELSSSPKIYDNVLTDPTFIIRCPLWGE